MFVYIEGHIPKLLNPACVAGFDIIPLGEEEQDSNAVVVMYNTGDTTVLYHDITLNEAIARLKQLKDSFNIALN